MLFVSLLGLEVFEYLAYCGESKLDDGVSFEDLFNLPNLRNVVLCVAPKVFDCVIL